MILSTMNSNTMTKPKIWKESQVWNCFIFILKVCITCGTNRRKIVDDDGDGDHDHDGKPYHEVVDSPLTTQRMRNPLPKS